MMIGIGRVVIKEITMVLVNIQLLNKEKNKNTTFDFSSLSVKL